MALLDKALLELGDVFLEPSEAAVSLEEASVLAQLVPKGCRIEVLMVGGCSFTVGERGALGVFHGARLMFSGAGHPQLGGQH